MRDQSSIKSSFVSVVSECWIIRRYKCNVSKISKEIVSISITFAQIFKKDMLQNWLSPLPTELLDLIQGEPQTPEFGKQIILFSPTLNRLGKTL